MLKECALWALPQRSHPPSAGKPSVRLLIMYRQLVDSRILRNTKTHSHSMEVPAQHVAYGKQEQINPVLLFICKGKYQPYTAHLIF